MELSGGEVNKGEWAVFCLFILFHFVVGLNYVSYLKPVEFAHDCWKNEKKSSCCGELTTAKLYCKHIGIVLLICGASLLHLNRYFGLGVLINFLPTCFKLILKIYFNCWLVLELVKKKKKNFLRIVTGSSVRTS